MNSLKSHLQTQKRSTFPERSSKKPNIQDTKSKMHTTKNPKIRQMPLITWLGGPYAILLQLSHPSIASASCAHSRFVTDGISRLRRTAAYIVSLTHGTEREQGLISGMICQQHACIKRSPHHSAIRAGQKDLNGYDARDAELQKWVAATIFKGMMVVDEVFGGASTKRSPENGASPWIFTACPHLGLKPPRTAMSRSEKESLLQEAANLATSLDMPPEIWFSSMEEFEAYFEDMISRRLFIAPNVASKPEETTVAVSGLSETSKKMGHTFLHEMKLPFGLFWLPALMRLLARAWLPDDLRREFGLGGLTERVKDGRKGCREIDEGLIWMIVMRWTFLTFIWFVWLVDWLMPMWLENWIVGFLVRDMQFAADEIERTGRWPM